MKNSFVLSLIKIILILFVPFFFHLNPFLPWPKDLIFEAAGYGNGVLFFLDAQKTGTPAQFFWAHTSYLLGQAILMIVYILGRATTFTTILNTSILAFLTILVTYFFAKKFLGYLGGIITLLLFSGSLFFLMVIKTAYPFYGTIPLTVSLTIFLFLLAHHESKKNLLLLSGVAFGFVGLSGGQATPLVLAILLSFLGWKVLSREKLFPVKYYIFTFLFALFVFLCFHAFFPLLNNNKPFDYLYDSYYLLSQRGGQVALEGDFSWRLNNFRRLIKAFFIDMNVPRQGHQHFLAGRAMIPLFVSFFFLVGVFVSLMKRKDIDKMLLLWLGIVFFFYGFIADFQIRYFVVVVPAIYVLSAKGMVHLIEKIKNVALPVFLALVIIAYLVGGYKDYYSVLANQAFKLEQYQGQEEMAMFVRKNYSPEDTCFVMGNIINVPPQNFIFYTWNKNYVFHYWDHFSERVSYTPIDEDLIRRNYPSDGKEFRVQDYYEWEKEKLKTYKKIVYIFGFYNDNLTPTRQRSLFREIRPYLKPKKVILAYNGLPQIGIYEVTAETLKITSRQFKLFPNQRQVFNAPSSGKLKTILFSGATENPKFYLNNLALELPVVTYPSEKMVLVFGGKSYLVFNPSFSSENFSADIYRQENIIHSPTAFSVSGEREQEGELVYKLMGPKSIERLNILFFPRILNDRQKKAYLKLSYSLDDKDYKIIYQLKSDGSGGWVGAWEKQERLVIFPQSKTVYLRFNFSGQEAQILSGPTATMSFEGEFEGETQPLRVRAGRNYFWFTGGKEPLSTSLFFSPD